MNVNLHHWFAYPWGLALLAVPPFLGLLAAWSTRRRRRALTRLGNLAALEAVLAPRRGPRLVRGLFLTLGLFALGLGVAGPQWGRDWDHAPAPGRDLLVVLDASRSMLAERPSRLERAKTALLDLADALRKRGGHRVALVAFAGRPRLVLPLTHDYDHFRAAIEEFSTDAADPALAPGPGDASGTRIGAALTLALQACDPRFPGASDVLLLSDGDDPAHDGEWHQGMAEAQQASVPVFTVGLGDPGSPKPLVLEDGKEVRTRLEEEPLREIARATGGEYFAARTQALPLGRLYLDWIAARPEREERDDALPVYQPRYGWFFLAAFGLLAGTMALPDRLPRWRRRDESVALEQLAEEPPGRVSLTAICLGLSALLTAAAPPASDPEELLRRGGAAFARGDFDEAAACFQQAELRATDPGRVALDLATTRYQQALQARGAARATLFQEAADLFRCCAEPGDPRQALALFGLANCLLGKAEGRDPVAVQEAVRALEDCLKVADGGPLAADARYNLELARLQAWQVHVAANDPSGKPPPGQDQDSSPPLPDRQTPSPGSDEKGTGRPDPRGTPVPIKPSPGQMPTGSDADRPPGQGNLPPVPDEAEAMPLPPRDAAEHLDRAAQRILEERQAHRRQKASRMPTPGVPDW